MTPMEKNTVQFLYYQSILGFDIATASREIQNDKSTNPAELIPYNILEMIENFAAYSNHEGNQVFLFKTRLLSLL
jgi:hypothetical protein